MISKLLLAQAVPAATAFAAALVLTPAVRALARRYDLVARPKADRWHTKPAALMGGVAIFLAVLVAELSFVTLSAGARAVLGASSFLFVVGLIDDLIELKPYQKLAGQLLAAAALIGSGLTLPWTGSPPLNAAFTLFWLVGITNAVNLLDNMDGLAAGIATIGCSSLGMHYYATGQYDQVLMLSAFGGALLGFLVYNSNPASIFMGDCGSLFIGFFLAGSALLSPSGGRSRAFLPILAVPVLTLFIPIFDTLFVMVLRKLVGRRVSQGGRDHTSHRLVALGLSERRAVLLLYGLAAVAGLLAVMVHDFPLDVSLAAILSFTVVLAMLGFRLAQVKVYDEAEMKLARGRPLVAILVDLSYKRRIFEVGLDVLLIVLSYYTAYALVFGPVSKPGTWERFLPVVAVLVVVKLPTFLLLGVYRGIWRYVSLDNLIVYAKAVVAGSLMSAVALLMLNRFQGISRAVVALDGLLLLAMLCGSRLSFRLFLRGAPSPDRRPGRRVLIFGAGDAGVLLAREFFNNPSLGCLPVGFVDDDRLKQGSVIHGLPVLDGDHAFRRVCRDKRVSELVIASTTISGDRVSAIARECRALNVSVRRMRLQIEPLDAAAVPAYLEPEPASA